MGFVVKNAGSELFLSAYHGKRVLVPGHTGFKGSWLCQWLLKLGAEVTGYSLPPATEPCLFDLMNVKSRVEAPARDWHLTDRENLAKLVRETQPDFVFHMAAQALVRESYQQQWRTFETNVMGTVNLLVAIRLRPGLQLPYMFGG